MSSSQFETSRSGDVPSIGGYEILADVERVCVENGFASWDAVVSACHDGAVFRIEFATQRADTFVKQFSALTRSRGLALGADRSLQLYLGAALRIPEFLKKTDHEVTAPASLIAGLGKTEGGATPIKAHSPDLRTRYSAGGEHSPDAPSFSARVLVLDDDPVSRYVLAAMLDHQGYHATSVGEAETAFELIRKVRPELIILDVDLGGQIDGVEFCSVIRQNPEFASIPAIFVTGHDTHGIRDRVQRIALSYFMEKPVKVSKLREIAAELIKAYRDDRPREG